MGVPTHYIKKRDLLHSEKSSAATLSGTGREFLKMERYSDALDFFEKARDMDGIGEIKRIALQKGDTFLLSRMDRFDRKLVTTEDWQSAAKTAEGSGRKSMADFAAKKLAPAEGGLEKKAPELPGAAPLAEV